VGRPILVFVSHTRELEKEVGLLKRRLPEFYHLYSYLNRGADGRPIREILREEIDGSNVFVGLVGHRHGSSYDATRSNVEWEFETATDRRDLEMLVFLKVAESEAAVDPPQREFRKRLAPGVGLSGRWVRFFDTSRGLLAEVRASLEEWLYRTYRNRELGGRPTGRGTPLLVTWVLLSMLIVFAAFWFDVSDVVRLAACTLALLSLGVGAWFLTQRGPIPRAGGPP
jgi:hypothetical protein